MGLAVRLHRAAGVGAQVGQARFELAVQIIVLTRALGFVVCR